MIQNLSTLARSESIINITKKLPSWISVILLMAIAWVLSSLVWFIFTPVATTHAQQNPSQPQQQPSPQNNPSSLVSSLHLFGVAGEKKKEHTPTEAPDTRLNLKLRGVYAIGNDGKGVALIASGSKPEKLIRIGEKLPGNIELEAVYPDRVIISRSGKSETLRLPASQSTGITRSAPRSRQATANAPSGNLKELRNELMRNPAKLAELINAAPARKAGRFVGYRITTLKQHPILSSLDLRSGDIVTRVNGIAINSPSSGMKALQLLSKASQVSITVDRNGQSLELNQTF